MMLDKQNSQLEHLVTVLESAEIQYWLDFGTLLGFFRDGGILQKKDGFDDIDLSAWSDNIDKLYQLKNKFIEIGYFPHYLSFGSRLLMLKLFPLTIKEGSVAVDIHIYRKKGNSATLAIPYVQNPYSRWSIRGVFFRLLSVSFNFFLNTTARGPLPCPQALPLLPPFSYLHSYAIIEVPISDIEPFSTLAEFKLSIPKNPESLLQGRYGNWKIKQEQWNFFSDQKDIKHRLSSHQLRDFLKGFSI
jgi:hypothetical protein